MVLGWQPRRLASDVRGKESLFYFRACSTICWDVRPGMLTLTVHTRLWASVGFGLLVYTLLIVS